MRLERDFKASIILKNISFQYEGPNSPKVLDDIDLIIPEGKITALVGASGSGKTTLMKLLLKFYPPVKGKIVEVGTHNEMTKQKGKYFELVKNQLELGS